jgi:phosphonate transport system substrate-binding protein
MRLRKLIALFAVLAMIAAACGGDDDANADPDKITVGFIPSERSDTLSDDIKPIMTALGDLMGIEVEGIVTADYNGLVVALGTGQVDVGAFGPVGYVQAKEQYGDDITLLLKSVRFGAPSYHGQWFATPEVAATLCDDAPTAAALDNTDAGVAVMDVTEVLATQVGKVSGSGNAEAEVLEDGTAVDPGLVCLGSIEDIKGLKVAFGSATSTSASVYPRLQLLDLGFDIEADIDYSYLGSHDDSVLAVYTGDFDIGVSFDDARRNLRKENPDVGSKVVVFNLTDEIPNDVVAVRSTLSDEFQQSLYDAIEDYLATDEGKAAFDEVYEWSAITTADDSEFDIVRDAVDKMGLTQ